MIFIYDCALFFYTIIIRLGAFFGKEKALLWLNGRKDIFSKIQNDLNRNQEKTLENDAKSLENAPKTLKTIWFHVSSLGEFEQGRPIIEALRNQKLPVKIILTFFSPSGYEMRKNYPLADHVFYLPIDNNRNAKRFLDLIQPDLAVFVKYEFWFHYLTQLQKRQVPILLVSAIFRERQFSKFNPYAPLLTRILKNFTKIFLQDTPSVFLLKKQGLDNRDVSGDTRVDRVAAIAAENKHLPTVEQFAGNAPVFVGGSTWEADEKAILPIFKNPKFKDWRFIFAPHDVSLKNIERLERLLPEKSIRYSEILKNSLENGANTEGSSDVEFQMSDVGNTSSEIRNSTSETQNTEGSYFSKKQDIRILIIDNVGMLSTLYRYGKIAYIGGGFGSGIHNTLEPIAYGLPVLFGPKYEKFTEAVRLAETGGVFVVNKEKSVEMVMLSILNAENYDKAAASAKDYITQNRGATEQVVEEIKKIIEK